ncbi:MAG: hypothetical protein IJO06_00325, partial [Thermoguttaceae bacterium]|nr:hypothetical protein [Thermoguttaceae bacterium]
PNAATPPNAPGGPGAPNAATPPNAPGGPGAPNAAAPPNASASTQKSEAAQRIEKLCGAKNAGVVGEPLSLEKLLYGVYSPSERYRRLAAYWDLVGKRAYFNLCAECANFANECAAKAQKKYDGATVPQETAAFLAASRLVAAQRREAARIDFIRSQHAFDAAFSSPAARRAAWERRRYEAQVAASSADAGNAAAQNADKNVGTPTSPVLYVPTAFPSVDVYATRFDEIARRRRVSNEAARLNVALPLLYEATKSRAEQARGEWNNLNAAFVAPETSETALFAALDRYLGASREMLAAATRYNQAIAAYVAETVPGSLRGVALLKTLNQRSSAAPTTEGKPNRGNAASTVADRKTFAAETSVASASYLAPGAAVVSAVAPASFVEPAPKPDLTPTPGARLEPAEPLPPTPEQPSTPAEPLPSTPEQPSTPAEKPASADESGPSTVVVTGYEQPVAAPSTPETPADSSEEKTPSDAASGTTSAALFVERIVRGQAPESPENAPAENAESATTQTAQKPQTPPPGAPPQNAQPPQTAQTPQTANAGAKRRVDETVAALFATPKAEPSPNGGAAGPLEVATTLRSALERVPVSERAATVRAYWRLQEASARVAVESALAQTLTQAFNELNAKSAGSETARLYLAAALGAQARVAEARIVKRDAQIALMRRTRRPLGEGWPIPSTLPFAGATYRLETPSTTSPTLALEGAVIPENLKALETLGAAFGPPATLCSFDVPPSSAADPLVPLATLEKKRESLLLFVELVVATNVSIAEYVASYPAGFVSVDRFVDALVGPGK